METIQTNLFEVVKKPHKQLVVETLVKGWHCYGEILAANEYASSLPRTVAKLREDVCTIFRDTEKGLIGTLNYQGKVYNWYEKLKGNVKYFYLEPLVK
jgi:hypothetical protein